MNVPMPVTFTYYLFSKPVALNEELPVKVARSQGELGKTNITIRSIARTIYLKTGTRTVHVLRTPFKSGRHVKVDSQIRHLKLCEFHAMKLRRPCRRDIYRGGRSRSFFGSQIIFSWVASKLKGDDVADRIRKFRSWRYTGTEELRCYFLRVAYLTVIPVRGTFCVRRAVSDVKLALKPYETDHGKNDAEGKDGWTRHKNKQPYHHRRFILFLPISLVTLLL